MSAPWQHVICRVCWEARNGYRPPVAIHGQLSEVCCFCGERTQSGIPIRFNPRNVRCEGRDGMHRKEKACA